MKTLFQSTAAAVLALLVVATTTPTCMARDLTIFPITVPDSADDDVAAATPSSSSSIFDQPARTNVALKGAPPANPEAHFAKKKQGGAKKKQNNLRARPATFEDAPAPVSMPGGNSNNNNAQGEQEQEEQRPGFDFIVAGFPKCGTTTLLKAFGAHDETDMAPSEQCSIASPLQADVRVHKLLDGTLATLSSDPSIKRSFKCPTAMYNYKSIARMEKHSPHTKFVIGMRHPVKMLQSFYNYRVTEIKERGLDEPIPSLEEVLAADEPWKGVSMESTRFELFLMQLGKTDMTAEHLRDLMGQSYDLAVKPTKFQVFLYTTDQLEDADEHRSAALRQTMQDYLGLSKPIQPFGHENKNHAVGNAAHAESISICDPQWAAVRQQLVEQGAKTAEWLREHLIHSPDVVVGNPEHFVETLASWGTDPCVVSAGQA